MRRLLVVLMALGLLAYAPVGAVAQGYALALGIQGRVQGDGNLSLLQNFSSLSDEELASFQGQGLIGGILGGLTGAIGAAMVYTIDAAIGCNTGRCVANAHDFAASVAKGFVSGFIIGLITPP